MSRKSEILTIAARLFREHGYHTTSLDDIAKQMNFTKPAIYYYFDSKEEILYEICLSGITRLVENTRQIESSDSLLLDKIKMIISLHIETFSHHRDVAGVYLSEEAELPIDKRRHLRSISREYEVILTNLLNQAIEEGIFRPMDSRMIVKAISGMCNWVSYWFRPEGPIQIHEIADIFIDFMLNGCLAEN